MIFKRKKFTSDHAIAWFLAAPQEKRIALLKLLQEILKDEEYEVSLRHLFLEYSNDLET